ncbi:hypothetical protein CDL12_28769 [Handroanthus impetiginosus]|uniref:Uncharacterized protein n=1 Tax=Handroanthus impetiginosus TaxID=429701 RepID=A0A2G9G093_9LAMI|nr:hypothetical protein CDL12_28769 [Handroanthus impetiginosus]
MNKYKSKFSSRIYKKDQLPDLVYLLISNNLNPSIVHLHELIDSWKVGIYLIHATKFW